MKNIKRFFVLTILFGCILTLTGCDFFNKKEEIREIEFDKTYEINNHETVKLPDNSLFTIIQLGNTTCDRDAGICPFDGLRVYYALSIGDKTYDQSNINESEYIVKTGKTDYKTFATVTISKKTK